MSAIRLHAADFYVLRTPLLPVEDHLRLTEQLVRNAEADPDGVFPKAVLAEAFARPEVRSAIELASRDLAESAVRCFEDPDRDLDRRAALALFRYLTRMASRPVPFGYFAGWTLGRVSDASRHDIAPLDRYETRTRVAFEWLCDLAQGLTQQSNSFRALRFECAETLQRVGALHQWVRLDETGDPPKQVLVRAHLDERFGSFLDELTEPTEGEELVQGLASAGLSAEEATDWLRVLVAWQVLTPLARPRVTGHDPLTHVIGELRRSRVHQPLAEQLSAIKARVRNLDAGPLTSRPTASALEPELRSVLGPSGEFRRVDLQGDVHKPGTATLDRTVVDEVLRAVETVWRLAPRHESPDLARFKELFAARYKEEEIPLLEAVDDRRGVGLPWIEPAAALPPVGRITPEPVASDAMRHWRPRERFLLARLAETLRAGRDTLKLTRGDLHEAGIPNAPEFPASFAIVFSLLGGPIEDRAGATSLLHTAYGPCSTSLIARFARGNDTLADELRRLAAREQAGRGDAVYAELVHLPEPRLGDVVSRPVLREYEITAGGGSDAPQARRISLDDLTIQVVGNDLRLRSRRLGKEVVPRLASAHNFRARGMGAYRLLALLQDAREILRGWDWAPFRGAPFLPRVVHGHVLLAPAQWTLSRGQAARLSAPESREAARERLEHALPPRVIVVDDGAGFQIDLTSPSGRAALAHFARQNQTLVLRESHLMSAAERVRGAEGRFVHDIVLPVLSEPAAPRRPVTRTSPLARECVRRFQPGSEWLYLRAFASVQGADEALAQTVPSLVQELVQADAVDGWYFLRYGKPDWHLRLRFHGDPSRLIADVLPASLNRLADPLVHSIEVATYVREVERFGGPDAIGLSERIFQVDSAAALRLISELGPGAAGLTARWQMAVAGCWDLLLAVDVPIARRLEILDRMRQSRRDRLKLAHTERTRVAARLRALNAPMSRVIEDPNRRRTARVRDLAPLLVQLTELEQHNSLATPLERILGAHLHLWINRLLPKATWPQENAIFELLYRLAAERAATDGELPSG